MKRSDFKPHASLPDCKPGFVWLRDGEVIREGNFVFGLPSCLWSHAVDSAGSKSPDRRGSYIWYGTRPATEQDAIEVVEVPPKTEPKPKQESKPMDKDDELELIRNENLELKLQLEACKKRATECEALAKQEAQTCRAVSERLSSCETEEAEYKRMYEDIKSRMGRVQDELVTAVTRRFAEVMFSNFSFPAGYDTIAKKALAEVKAAEEKLAQDKADAEKAKLAARAAAGEKVPEQPVLVENW